MIEPALMSALLDNLKVPLVFVDADHVIRYMNKAGVAQYADRGGADLAGRSLLACHNEVSSRRIVEIVDEMRGGLDERQTADDDRHRAYMCAVRDEAGNLLGYYERYEPPA